MYWLVFLWLLYLLCVRRDVKNGVWLYYGLCVSGGERCCGLQLSVMLPEPAHLPDLPIIHLTAVWSPGEYGRRNAGFNVKSVIVYSVPNDLFCDTDQNLILHSLKDICRVTERGARGQTVSGAVYPHVRRVRGQRSRGWLKADLLIGVIWF